jgi:hypothetical protein
MVDLRSSRQMPGLLLNTTTSLQRFEFIKRYEAWTRTKIKKISLTVPQQFMSKSRIISSSSRISRLTIAQQSARRPWLVSLRKTHVQFLLRHYGPTAGCAAVDLTCHFDSRGGRERVLCVGLLTLAVLCTLCWCCCQKCDEWTEFITVDDTQESTGCYKPFVSHRRYVWDQSLVCSLGKQRTCKVSCCIVTKFCFVGVNHVKSLEVQLRNAFMLLFYFRKA